MKHYRKILQKKPNRISELCAKIASNVIMKGEIYYYYRKWLTAFHCWRWKLARKLKQIEKVGYDLFFPLTFLHYKLSHWKQRTNAM